MMLAVMLLCFALPAPSLGQDGEQTERRTLAASELNEGAREYKAGKFYEAQKRFERALELDPSNKNTLFFIARATHAQFKPGIDTPENVAQARAAIAAYQRVLTSKPSEDEPYNAIVYLYRQIKDEAGERQWLMTRAADPQVPAVNRAQTYTLMASYEWKCSYAITESKENKATVSMNGRAIVKYRKPKNKDAFVKAKQCAQHGLELVEQAVNFDTNSLQAWFYKANILFELVKLSEMEGRVLDQLVSYQKQAYQAQRRTDELFEQDKKAREAQEKKRRDELPPQTPLL
jgi:tetratricopeptide (TPR) repeat protein